MKIKLKSVYYAMFIVLFFISYNITIYGYFIPNYIVLAIGLFFILLSFYMQAKEIKIRKKNMEYILAVLLITFIYVFRNKQLSINILSSTTYFFAILLLFLLQFSDKWIEIPYKIINLFTYEHLIGTYFVFLFPDIYKKIVLPIFKSSSGYADLINQVNANMNAGFTGNYGINALYLTIGFITMFSRCIAIRKFKRKDIILLVFTFLGIVLTVKRGPLIFGIITIIIEYILVNKEKIPSKIFKLSISIILIAIFMISASSTIPSISHIYDRIFNSSDVLNGRERLYSLAISLFNEHTFFGIGWGNFKYYYSLYYNTSELLNVHNVYLQLLCETGIIGTIVIVFFMLKSAIKSYRMQKSGLFEKYNVELATSFALQLFVILIGISSTPLYGIEALYIYIISCIIPYSISFNNEGEIKYEKIKDK